MMKFEVPFTVCDAFKLEGRQRSRYTESRLLDLAEYAAKLRRAGWNVWFTLSGLGIEPPADMQLEGGFTDDEYSEYLELIGEQLAGLGIHEGFAWQASNTVAETPACWLGGLWGEVYAGPKPAAPRHTYVPGQMVQSPQR